VYVDHSIMRDTTKHFKYIRSEKNYLYHY